VRRRLRPPAGAVTVVVVDEWLRFRARWMSRELIEDKGIAGMALAELVDELDRDDHDEGDLGAPAA
jgi:hypothetical protein